MKVHLLHHDHDLDAAAQVPAHADALVADLHLETILDAMAGGDRFVYDVARQVLLQPLTDLDDLAHRQGILRDCLDHPATIRELYALVETVFTDERRRGYFSLIRTPTSVLAGSVRVLDFLVEMLHALRDWVDAHAVEFASPGWQGFCDRLHHDLDHGYLDAIDEQLRRLRFADGVTFGARVGRGLKPAGLTLHPPAVRRAWVARLLPAARSGWSFTIAPRDDAGTRALGELRDRALEDTAAAVGEAAEHIRDFFTVLRRELAFWIGCVNLHDRLTTLDAPTCIPRVEPAHTRSWTARGLYDPALRLSTSAEVVGLDLDADGKELILITGANQGGKTTFLRALGTAQLMAQSGMFTAAEQLATSTRVQVITHFRREEDATMERGKLEEELERLHLLVPALAPGNLLLLNESFASTNEREGSQIADGVVRAVGEHGVTIVYVTHLYELAIDLHREERAGDLFLLAEPGAEGLPRFRLRPGAPRPTSHGVDLYDVVFGGAP